jgi:hypothetical protein
MIGKSSSFSSTRKKKGTAHAVPFRCHFAYSTARVSRTTVTRICPG